MSSSINDNGNASSTLYQYERLASNLGEIRLIKIVNVQEHPEEDSIVLEVAIRHTSFDQASPYIAISYAWGNPAPTHKLLVDGAALYVPENTFRTLYTVYHAVQNSETELYTRDEQPSLWIDAICINQSDVSEKDDQVRGMGQIYSQAVGAIGYIGRPTTGKSPVDGFNALLWMGGHLDFTRAGDIFVDQPAQTWNRDPGRFPEELGPIKKFAEAYNDLFSSDWFSRGWVVQEIVLSRETICLYGYGSDFSGMSLTILIKLFGRAYTLESADCLNAIYRAMGAVIGLNSVRVRNHSQVVGWFGIRKLLGEKQPAGLGVLELLEWTRRGKASDPRDKIYSLMGMMKEDDRSAIRVDYSDDYTPANLFLDIAIHCVGTPDGHQLLHWAGLQPHRIILDLPSWIPDWSAPDHTVMRSEGFFHASANLSRPLTPRHESGGRKISAVGIPVDTITFLTPPMTVSDGPAATPVPFWVVYFASLLCYLLQTITNYNGSHATDTYQFNNEPWNDVIWRTCCMDCHWSPFRRATLDDRPAFEAFLEQFRFGTDALATVALDLTTGVPRVERPELPLNNPLLLKAAEGFGVAVLGMQEKRVFGTTEERGFIGSFPEGTREGDVVVVLIGGELPVVLRPLGGEEKGFELVGACYVHGIMDGEWIKAAADAAGGEERISEKFVEYEIQ